MSLLLGVSVGKESVNNIISRKECESVTRSLPRKESVTVSVGKKESVTRMSDVERMSP